MIRSSCTGTVTVTVGSLGEYGRGRVTGHGAAAHDRDSERFRVLRTTPGLQAFEYHFRITAFDARMPARAALRCRVAGPRLRLRGSRRRPRRPPGPAMEKMQLESRVWPHSTCPS
eukprot:632101-Rhodomonas_salina.1